MDDSGTQTCLQHENMLVPVQNHWECTGTHIHIFDITIFGGGSGERVPTLVHALCLSKRYTHFPCSLHITFQ